MAGPGALDQLFDFVEGGLDAITGTSRARPQRPTSVPTPAAASPFGRIEILECTDAVTGREVFVVKCGNGDTADCSSRAIADRIKRALETS